MNKEFDVLLVFMFDRIGCIDDETSACHKNERRGNVIRECLLRTLWRQDNHHIP